MQAGRKLNERLPKSGFLEMIHFFSGYPGGMISSLQGYQTLCFLVVVDTAELSPAPVIDCQLQRERRSRAFVSSAAIPKRAIKPEVSMASLGAELLHNVISSRLCWQRSWVAA